MPMVTVKLPCGCPVVTWYRSRVRWKELPKTERDAIVAAAAKAHECRQTKALKNPEGVPLS